METETNQIPKTIGQYVKNIKYSYVQSGGYSIFENGERRLVYKNLCITFETQEFIQEFFLFDDRLLNLKLVYLNLQKEKVFLNDLACIFGLFLPSTEIFVLIKSTDLLSLKPLIKCGFQNNVHIIVLNDLDKIDDTQIMFNRQFFESIICATNANFNPESYEIEFIRSKYIPRTHLSYAHISDCSRINNIIRSDFLKDSLYKDKLSEYKPGELYKLYLLGINIVPCDLDRDMKPAKDNKDTISKLTVASIAAKIQPFKR